MGEQSRSIDRLELAEALRHYGLEMLKLAADVEADVKRDTDFKLPVYTPRFEVTNGIEAVTNRLACCGSGPSQRDERTGERLHLPGCRHIAADGLVDCHNALHGIT